MRGIELFQFVRFTALLVVMIFGISCGDDDSNGNGTDLDKDSDSDSDADSDTDSDTDDECMEDPEDRGITELPAG